MARIFSVRINLDTLASTYRLALTAEQKAAWADGFFYGVSGGIPPAGYHPDFVAGADAGLISYREARAHQAASAAGGKKSIAMHPENKVRRRTESPTDPPPKGPSESPTDPPLDQSSNPVIEESNKPAIEVTRRFKPPTVDDVKAHAVSMDYWIDAERFVAFYASKGWVVGKSPMKNWKRAVTTWWINDGRPTLKPKNILPPQFYDQDAKPAREKICVPQ